MPDNNDELQAAIARYEAAYARLMAMQGFGVDELEFNAALAEVRAAAAAGWAAHGRALPDQIMDWLDNRDLQ
jgi:hypothetical protein